MKKRVFSAVLVLCLLFSLGWAAVPQAGATDTGRVGMTSTISAGSFYAAAIGADGSLYTWGTNMGNELGSGNDDDSFVPIRVAEGFASVCCGGLTAAGIGTDGSLYTWGNNDVGQTGTGTWSDKPVKIMDNVTAISCGDLHMAAITADGSLYMWGDNTEGQLGNNGYTDSRDNAGDVFLSRPSKVMDNVAAVSCGVWHTAVIKTDGSLWMFGGNKYGQLGTGGTQSSKTPVHVMDGVSTVSCGSWHTAAVKNDGTLYTWGSNYLGQLGTGNLHDSLTPVAVMTGVSAVSCGVWHTAAIKTDGSLYTWGSYGYEGHSIAAGGTFNFGACASSNALTCIGGTCGSSGSYSSGNSGNYSSGNYSAAVDDIASGGVSDGDALSPKISDDESDDFLAGVGSTISADVMTGSDGDIQVYSDGSLTMGAFDTANFEGSYAAGEFVSNSFDISSFPGATFSDGSTPIIEEDQVFGALGAFGAGPAHASPEYIMGNVAAVSCGIWHTQALTKDGTLYTWGSNDWGELGNGSTTGTGKPTAILYNVALPAGTGSGSGVTRQAYGSFASDSTDVPAPSIPAKNAAEYELVKKAISKSNTQLGSSLDDEARSEIFVTALQAKDQPGGSSSGSSVRTLSMKPVFSLNVNRLVRDNEG